MKRVIISIFLLLLFTFNLNNKAAAEENQMSAYILIEAETGAVLEEKNSDIPLNAGYMTKLMSLLLIAEDIETGRYNLSTVLTASKSVNGTKGSVIWLEPGDSMTVDELLKSIIIGNANDALTVLAERSEGTVENFTARMNSEAFDMKLRSAAFYSPYGYDCEKEKISAHDIAKICRKLSKFSFMEEYFRTWRDFVKEGTVELVNENYLARTFEHNTGFKACHSELSGYCAAIAGKNNDGTVYITVILGSESEESSIPSAKQLVKKGFSDFKVTTPGFNDEFLRPVKVKNGVDSAVEICLRNQSVIVVPKGVTELSNVIFVPEYLEAPLYKGQKIGTAAFYNGDTLVYETDIIVQNNVNKLSFKYVFRKILSSFTN